ncbi:hypothetical protein [Bifidobacterium cuniculi]|uniref:Lipoprotein n=1 Tax=Bifidobacterium cuniculi TaxID=1688 RepID=A0A087ADI8_9BIFI|nr:hypothetical protein [Bifidobacterium cuniculi]KFI56838.1 hypothetical protein BCUN_2160 [Bifidobacterium cuniculi]
MTHQAHTLRIVVSALSATLLATTAACGTSQGNTAAPSVSETAMQITMSADDMRTALHDETNGANPLELLEPTPAVHTVHNQSDAEYEPGTYRLMVQCN